MFLFEVLVFCCFTNGTSNNLFFSLLYGLIFSKPIFLIGIILYSDYNNNRGRRQVCLSSCEVLGCTGMHYYTELSGRVVQCYLKPE